MGTLLDLASLVVVPSGYKTSKVYSVKPTDGSGDLDFTRSNDTATRVNSAGLIEKVRTNLILQSNTFSTTWVNTQSTDTSGQSGYDGTSNAWLLQSTASPANEAYIRQTISASGSNTFSIYAKAGTSNFIAFYIDATSGSDPFAFFNLSTGAVGSTSASATASIVSVGSGWYRCSVAFNATIQTCDVYVVDANGSFNSTSGANVVIQDAQLESGDIATDYIPTTSAAVSVGMLANVPRLDYSGGGCPKLLLEPQRTNSLTYSEAFDNAAWSKANATIDANTSDILDPSGYNGADKITDNTTNAGHLVFRLSTWDTTQRTASVYAKAGTSSKITIQNASLGTGVFADLSNGTIVVSSGFTGTITAVGNGWYRITATHTAASSQTFAIGLFTGTSTTNYPGTGSYAYIWGAQLEAGSYATSYIPTLGAAVTRGADLVQKTSISSLIGQSEGVVFLDYTLTQADNSNSEFSISAGSNSNAIRLRQSSGNFLQGVVQNGGVTQASIITTSSVVIGQRYKIAFAYANDDFAMYVNGELIGIDGSGSVPACSQIQNTNGGASSSADLAGAINQAILFPTRLTNTQLQELTTL